jgi:transcriptional regulator with XRE-family HTH domain
LSHLKNEGQGMLSETLAEGLNAYRIGPRIRALRTGKAMGLAQLGAHTGLSAGMLSKIERGQVFPTLPTLLRIALVFGVGLDHFFAPDADRPVLEIVRRAERISLPDRAAGPMAYRFESLDFPVADRRLHAYLADFPAGGPDSPAHAHAGAEVIYVLDGAVEVSIHGGTHRLEVGDAMHFDSGFDHSYRAGGSRGGRVLVALHGEDSGA